MLLAFRENTLIPTRFPHRKTYVSPGGAISFRQGKPKKRQDATASLPNHFQYSTLSVLAVQS